MKPSDFVGKVCIHDQLGRVTVDSVVEKSRTMVNVTVIQRGKGWDEIKQKHTGYNPKGLSGGVWARGENREFGNKDFVHIKTLRLDE